MGVKKPVLDPVVRDRQTACSLRSLPLPMSSLRPDYVRPVSRHRPPSS